VFPWEVIDVAPSDSPRFPQFIVKMKEFKRWEHFWGNQLFPTVFTFPRRRGIAGSAGVPIPKLEERKDII
jgi:hypothetical protein